MRPVSLVVLILGFAVAAFLIGRDLSRPPEHALQSVSSDRGGSATAVDVAAFERLSRSVDALQSSVDRLSRRLDQWPALSDSRATAAAQDRLVADRPIVEGISSIQPKPGEATASFRAAPDPERRKRFDELKGKEFLAINRAHWFWTFEDAIQHYGPPDEIHPAETGRVDFVYEIGDRVFLLQFYGGRLLVINQ